LKGKEEGKKQYTGWAVPTDNSCFLSLFRESFEQWCYRQVFWLEVQPGRLPMLSRWLLGRDSGLKTGCFPCWDYFLQLRDSSGFTPDSLLILAGLLPAGTDNGRKSKVN